MDAHLARLVRRSNPSLHLVLVSLLSFLTISFSASEIDNLLSFKASLENPAALNNWNASTPPCVGDRANWVGVLCLKNKIYGLQLENMGLAGMVNIDTLATIPNFRTLSLMNNYLEGAMPDINKLSALKALYLSNNRFSGDIDDDAFLNMKSLTRLFLANNGFTGKIPLSLTKLPNLAILKLEGNQFDGEIPDFKLNTLKVVNLASNQLEGPIPPSLSKLNPSMFSGNKNLCGKPLEDCSTIDLSPLPNDEASALKIALTVISIILILVILAFMFFLTRKKQQKSQQELDSAFYDNPNKQAPIDEAKKVAAEVAAAMESGGPVGKKRNDQTGKLIFLKDFVVFDLQELLRASAEVLGSGNFGASYKAVVNSGEEIVVKRYKQMSNVRREDFYEHMRRLGRLNHQNLLPLVAYYHKRDEKLLVTEFLSNGSLASRLHAKSTIDLPSLDWPTRLKIIKGVARGLSYLYKELPTLAVPHGHLKSSNILLNSLDEAVLCDYALRPIVNQEQAHSVMTAYKSPEYALNGRISKNSDVWCLGLVILEILTGKFPENYLAPSYDSKTSLSTWVNEMVKEKKTSEVFDKDMEGTYHSKAEMINLLKIGLSCCEEDVERRPEMKEVAQKIEDLTEEDTDQGNAGDAMEEEPFSVFNR